MDEAGCARTIEAARNAARTAFKRRALIRVVFASTADGNCVATSPDADWLFVIAPSHASAKAKAIAAIVKISVWSGAQARFCL